MNAPFFGEALGFIGFRLIGPIMLGCKYRVEEFWVFWVLGSSAGVYDLGRKFGF